MQQIFMDFYIIENFSSWISELFTSCCGKTKQGGKKRRKEKVQEKEVGICWGTRPFTGSSLGGFVTGVFSGQRPYFSATNKSALFTTQKLFPPKKWVKSQREVADAKQVAK